MVKQVQELLQNYPWIVLVLAAMVLLGVGITVAVILILKAREAKNSSPFELLDQHELPPDDGLGQRQQPVPPISDDDDLTRRLFDYPEMELKSYQLELCDLGQPDQVYRVSVTDRITVGRKEHCMVCIPNSTLSGEHCEIVLKNGKLYLHDLNSTNGTYLNGSPNRVTEALLESGSIIEMGAVKLKARISIIKL